MKLINLLELKNRLDGTLSFLSHHIYTIFHERGCIFQTLEIIYVFVFK